MIIDVIFLHSGLRRSVRPTGGFRELICFGTFAGIKPFDFKIAAFESPFGGFYTCRNNGRYVQGAFTTICVTVE